MTFTFEALVIWVDLFSDSPFYSFLPFFFYNLFAAREYLRLNPRATGAIDPLSAIFCVPDLPPLFLTSFCYILHSSFLLPSVAFIVPIRCNNFAHSCHSADCRNIHPQSICAGHMYNLILSNFPNRCLIPLCASSYFLPLLSVASTCA